MENKTLVLILSLFSFIVFGLASSTVVGLSYTELEKRVQADLFLHLKAQKSYIQKEDVRFSILNALDIAKKCEPADSYTLILTPQALIEGKTIIPIQFLNSVNQVISRTNLQTHISVSSHFLKTKHLIKGGQTITTSDVDLVYVDEYAKPINAIRSLSSLEGKQTVVQLGKDVYLAEFMFKRVPIIKKGQTITVHVVKDNLLLSVPGEALDDGLSGQKLKVKIMLHELKVMEGVVVDSKNVRIDSLR